MATSEPTTAPPPPKVVVLNCDYDHRDGRLNVELRVGEGDSAFEDLVVVPHTCDHSSCIHPDDIDWSHVDGLSDALQTVWRDTAPEHERNCDWWRSLDEPWSSLRAIVGHA